MCIPRLPGPNADRTIADRSTENVCSANHVGSSGILESDSVVQIFARSVYNLSVQMSIYYVDGGDRI